MVFLHVAGIADDDFFVAFFDVETETNMFGSVLRMRCEFDVFGSSITDDGMGENVRRGLFGGGDDFEDLVCGVIFVERCDVFDDYVAAG